MTLKQIFETQTPALRKELEGMVLPKDSSSIEKIVSTNLSNLFNDDGEYRQNLTQSEDYILQAALSLLKAQQEITINLANDESAKTEIVPSPLVNVKNEDASIKTDDASSFEKQPVTGKNAILGSAGGALAGNLLFGGWGAVFGAIAGTAVVIYVATSQKPKVSTEPERNNTQSIKVDNNKPIDVDKFIDIIGQICDSVDNLIETFRAQIKKVVTKYESQEKPTIERDFRVLLEGIQSLIGYKRGHSPEDEKYLPKLQTRIEDVAEILDNYDLEAVDYTPDHSEWFEAVESKNTTEIRMVTPAITKKGNLVLKGKIFIPKTL